jgi:peroxiredoxin
MLKALPLILAGFLAFSLPAKAEETAQMQHTDPFPALVAPEVGKPAPDFTRTDTNGQEVNLSALKGKTVVLEWTNHLCPFVKKHYGSGNMQKLQEEAAANGVVWISVISSAHGMEGNITPEEANKITLEQNAHPAHKILDEPGTLGRLYDAKTTPHVFVIDKDGTLVYAGAIDNDDSVRPVNNPDTKNYVREALNALKDGKPIETPSTKPYGCSVKYAH